MDELIRKIGKFVDESSQRILSLEDSNKKLREEIDSLTRELEQKKLADTGVREIENKYKELLEERSLIQKKVENVLEQINRLHIADNGNN